MPPFYFLSVGYLTTLSGSRLNSIDDRIIKEYGTVCGIKIGRGNGSSWRKPAPVSPSIYDPTEIL
jgi:hypothetical protein